MYTMIVPGEGFCSLQVVSGGIVMDEIDTCIMIETVDKLAHMKMDVGDDEF